MEKPMNRRALVLIDMQKFFFVENPLVDHRGLARACDRIAEMCRQAGVPVIHVTTVYRADRADWPSAWRDNPDSWCANLVRGRPLAEVVDGLQVRSGDLTVEKKRFSAFHNTNLDDLLRGLGCDGIDVVGYAGDVCVRFTCVDAYNRGYRVTLVEDGVESFRETRKDSFTYLEWLINATSVSLDDYREILTAGAR
jgi:nicotinamidase-related amidase